MFTHEMIKSFNQLEMDVYNYIISNEEKVVYMKVRELAEEVHVSTTTNYFLFHFSSSLIKMMFL